MVVSIVPVTVEDSMVEEVVGDMSALLQRSVSQHSVSQLVR